jgi:hypothetical protein
LFGRNPINIWLFVLDGNTIIGNEQRMRVAKTQDKRGQEKNNTNMGGPIGLRTIQQFSQ